jgi:hypothetical protein
LGYVISKLVKILESSAYKHRDEVVLDDFLLNEVGVLRVYFKYYYCFLLLSFSVKALINPLSCFSRRSFICSYCEESGGRERGSVEEEEVAEETLGTSGPAPEPAAVSEVVSPTSDGDVRASVEVFVAIVVDESEEGAEVLAEVLAEAV